MFIKWLTRQERVERRLTKIKARIEAIEEMLGDFERIPHSTFYELLRLRTERLLLDNKVKEQNQ